MKKKRFDEPIVEVIYFGVNEILTDSVGNGDYKTEEDEF